MTATLTDVCDAQTLRQHGFLSETRLETPGQVYLDVEPEFPMVAF